MVLLKLRRFLLLQKCMPLLWCWILASVTFCPTLFRILRPIYASSIRTVTQTVMELFKNKQKSSEDFGKFSNFTQMQERNIIDNFEIIMRLIRFYWFKVGHSLFRNTQTCYFCLPSIPVTGIRLLVSGN